MEAEVSTITNWFLACNTTDVPENGGTLEQVTSKQTGFVSQRARLIFNYKSSRIIFQTSLQNVRVWGQDASSISNADGNKLFVHEALAELILSNKKDTSFKKSPFDYLGLKIGR